MSFPVMNCESKNIKWQYYAIQNIITKSKFGDIQIINIRMDVGILFYVWPLFTVGSYFSEP